MANTSMSTADQFIQEVWSKTTNDATQANLILNPLMDHRFEAESAGTPTDKIHVNGFDNFGATSQITTSGVGATSALSYSTSSYIAQVDIDINRHFYLAFALDHDADLFSNVPQMASLREKASYAVSLEEDTFIAGFADGLGSAQQVGTLAVSIEDDDIILGQRVLNDANIPQSDRHFVFSSIQDADFKKVERYVNQDYSAAIGSIPTAHGPGLVNSGLHGVNWYMTTNLDGSNAAGHDNVLFHRNWVAVVGKDKMRTEGPFYDIDADTNKLVVHNFYGVAQMGSDWAVWMKGL